MSSPCFQIRLLEVILDEDRWLTLVVLLVLQCQRDVWNYKHLEEGLKIAFDEVFVVREGCTFAKVANYGEDQPFTLTIC